MFHSSTNGGSLNINFLIENAAQLNKYQIPTNLLVSVLKLGKPGRTKLLREVNKLIKLHDSSDEINFLKDVCSSNELSKQDGIFSGAEAISIPKLKKIISEWLSQIAKKNKSSSLNQHRLFSSKKASNDVILLDDNRESDHFSARLE